MRTYNYNLDGLLYRNKEMLCKLLITEYKHSKSEKEREANAYTWEEWNYKQSYMIQEIEIL